MTSRITSIQPLTCDSAHEAPTTVVSIRIRPLPARIWANQTGWDYRRKYQRFQPVAPALEYITEHHRLSLTYAARLLRSH